MFADALLDQPVHASAQREAGPAQQARVSYSGRPITPEWLPESARISASARPWMA
jgi:hypothetical protein